MGKTLFPLEKGFPHVTARPNLISVGPTVVFLDKTAVLKDNRGV